MEKIKEKNNTVMKTNIWRQAITITLDKILLKIIFGKYENMIYVDKKNIFIEEKFLKFTRSTPVSILVIILFLVKKTHNKKKKHESTNTCRFSRIQDRQQQQQILVHNH